MPKKGRGVKKALADQVGVQTAYVSRVLNSDSDFSLEHALKVSTFLGLSKEQSNYFLMLVNFARAGTFELKALYKSNIKNAQDNFKKINKRLKKHRSIGESEKQRYYSSWEYAAIHIALSLKNINTLEDISSALKVEKPLVSEILEFFESFGLIRKDEDHHYQLLNEVAVHLDSTSPEIFQYHTNYRVMALHHLSNSHSEDMHFTDISSLNKKDIEVLREILLKTIQDYSETVSKSEPEDSLQVICLDFFNLI
jgi:uncharacterized protein (TIGR02147 family)